MSEVDDGVGTERNATAAEVADRSRVELLLHSMAELREIIIPCLDIVGARTVIEIGAEEGLFTEDLLAWAEQRGGRVLCVDPRPAPGLTEMCERSAAATLVQQSSPDAIEDLEHADVYLLDGDHNYYVVSKELETISRKSEATSRPALVLLNDTGWPCGRRDLYYSPDSLPPDAVHPYSYECGATLGSTNLVEGGLRGEGEWAFAVKEGGPANGVLTAVEDFLEGKDELRFANVPCVFGVGVIYDGSAPYAEALAGHLEPYDANPLLERLEANRLALYLRVLELQDLNAELLGHLEDCQLRLTDQATQNRALWARTRELDEEKVHLRSEVEHLLRSRAFVVAERLSAPTRMRGGAGVSRQRLRAALDRSSP